MRGPRSATGEDTVELHVPGNPILARMVMDTLVVGGASPAEPGGFTAKAYFNGNLDLAAAEGVAAVISAQNAQQLNAARQLMSGELSRRLRPIMDRLAETLALVETGLDFSEEDITVLDRDELLKRVEQIERSLVELLDSSGRFAALPTEPTIVLVGRPNAGKSSLLNALAGADRAVVSSTAGTTRDALSATVCLRRGIVRLVDVAGIEPAADDASDIEIAMQHSAVRTINEADVVVLVRDVNDQRIDPPLPIVADLIVTSKCDLNPKGAIADGVSVMDGRGLQQLRDQLDQLAFQTPREVALSLNSRHEQAITFAGRSLARIQNSTDLSAEIDALQLREALDYLGSIIGVITPDEILGKIFSTFCIGK